MTQPDKKHDYMTMFDGTQVCNRCGRPHTLDNAMHTRLYGYTCVCGNQEWVKATTWQMYSGKGGGDEKSTP